MSKKLPPNVEFSGPATAEQLPRATSRVSTSILTVVAAPGPLGVTPG